MAQVPTRGVVLPGAPLGSTNIRPGGIIPADPRNPNWRRRLQMASFKSAPFYVDQQGRSSGRRTVLHQYPKRDIPYAEDMGREAMRYQITAYLIMAPNWIPPIGQTYSRPPTYGGYGGSRHFTEYDHMAMLSNYDDARDRLEAQLYSKSPGRLIDPYNPRLALVGYGIGTGPLLFMCERYTIVEQREKGGYCSLEMSFVEAGIPGNNSPTVNTVGVVSNTSNAATNAAATQLDTEQGAVNI